jgi:hypothetical protein
MKQINVRFRPPAKKIFTELGFRRDRCLDLVGICSGNSLVGSPKHPGDRTRYHDRIRPNTVPAIDRVNITGTPEKQSSAAG